MRIILLSLLTIVALSSFVCKKKKKKTKEMASTETVKTMGAPSTDSAVWYKVSFISKGEGIDYESLELTNQTIAAFEKDNKVNIEYKKASWGREGEKDYCFALGLLEPTLAKKFQTTLEEVLIHSDRVRYKYDCKCDKYREIVPE